MSGPAFSAQFRESNDRWLDEQGVCPVWWPGSRKWTGMITLAHNSNATVLHYVSGRLEHYIREQIALGRWPGPRLLRLDDAAGPDFKSINVPEYCYEAMKHWRAMKREWAAHHSEPTNERKTHAYVTNRI